MFCFATSLAQLKTISTRRNGAKVVGIVHEEARSWRWDVDALVSTLAWDSTHAAIYAAVMGQTLKEGYSQAIVRNRHKRNLVCVALDKTRLSVCCRVSNNGADIMSKVTSLR